MSDNPTTGIRVVNIDLLDRALAQIDAHPDEWDQNNWHCGTSMCLAGWVGTVTGARWATSAMYEPCVVDLESHRVAHVADYARDRLGITATQGDALFNGYNTRAALQAMRDLLAEKPDATRLELTEAAYIADPESFR
jgi:hypothetical protein